MARQRNDLHVKQVEAWKSKNPGLSDRELQQLIINGVFAIRRKSLGILSNVTVTIVVDRVLLECQERFPILSEIKSDADGLHFAKFAESIHDSKPEDIEVALQDLLVELLEVFGKITADILTKNLYQELMTVTSKTSLPSSLATKNRDQK